MSGFQTSPENGYRCECVNNRIAMPGQRGFDYLAKVINGVEFKDGIEVKSDDRIGA